MHVVHDCINDSVTMPALANLITAARSFQQISINDAPESMQFTSSETQEQ